MLTTPIKKAAAAHKMSVHGDRSSSLTSAMAANAKLPLKKIKINVTAHCVNLLLRILLSEFLMSLPLSNIAFSL